MDKAEEQHVDWFVYVLKSTTLSRTYVGVAVDPERRLRQHNGELVAGARSTRAGRPWEIAVRYGPFLDQGEAQEIEAAVKRLRGAARLKWKPTANPKSALDSTSGKASK
ncbi:MAG: putative endonuclease [Planctomycetota bacterium]